MAMPRFLRLNVPAYTHHVIQRGNNRQPIFGGRVGGHAEA